MCIILGKWIYCLHEDLHPSRGFKSFLYLCKLFADDFIRGWIDHQICADHKGVDDN